MQPKQCQKYRKTNLKLKSIASRLIFTSIFPNHTIPITSLKTFPSFYHQEVEEHAQLKNMSQL